jgi:aryl-alcohol dehydrogenase-like predicted oxidoreductase
MKQKPLGNSGLSASIVGLGAWVLGGGQIWGTDTNDADGAGSIQPGSLPRRSNPE